MSLHGHERLKRLNLVQAGQSSCRVVDSLVMFLSMVFRSTELSCAIVPHQDLKTRPIAGRRTGARFGVAEIVVATALIVPLLCLAGESGGGAREFSPSGVRYVYVPAGSFEMGCVQVDQECRDNEMPRHRVILTRGFWMMVTEVTVSEYMVFANETGRSLAPAPDFDPKWEHGNRPIIKVTWQQAQDYCRWAGGRLPTEAEWEYAARGGRQGEIYPWGNEISADNANFMAPREEPVFTLPVGSFAPNGFGIFDMAGNVFEWVADWCCREYSDSPITDPAGPPSGTYRVVRGGAWPHGPRGLRLSARFTLYPESRISSTGFRCVRDADEDGDNSSPGCTPR